MSEQHAGVRVMTVHAAKGLEFETVAVADLGRPLCVGGQPPELRLDFEVEAAVAAAGEGPPPARVGLRLARAGATSIDTEGYSGLNESAADAEAEESGRLVYVAASRAQRRLILSGTFADKDLEASEKPRRSRSALGCLLPALAVEAVDGETVTIPAPAPREGLDEAFAVAEVSVRVIGAGAETVSRLSRDRRGDAASPSPPAAGRPPLIELADGGAAAARSLSYAALSDYRRCGYRFLVERVIGLGRGYEASAPATSSAGSDAGGRRRMGFGRAAHSLLEWSARNGWSEPGADRIDSALAREGAAGAEARARDAVVAWLGSDLLAELRDGGATFRPEVPFRIELGADAVLRGTIDLLAEARGMTWVVDFKTDRLSDGVPAELPAHYALQRDLYAAAVAEATGAEEVRAAYVFLEAPESPIVATLDRAAIAAGRERVEAVVSDIRASRFEATPTPHIELCHDCPARDRLCPHPKELTGRAGGDGLNRLAVFGYGSLVSPESSARTLGASAGPPAPATLHGWRRGFNQARRNREVEKTFARADTGEVPEWILGLGVASDPEGWVNGALIEVDEAAAARLDLREIRYERVDVTGSLDPAPEGLTVFTYEPRPENRAPEPPPGAVMLRSYLTIVEAAFAELGPGELERFRESTDIPAVETVDGRLVRDEIPPGNPRDW